MTYLQEVLINSWQCDLRINLFSRTENHDTPNLDDDDDDDDNGSSNDDSNNDSDTV